MRRKWLVFIPMMVVLAYLAGPSPSAPVYSKDLPSIPSEPAALEKYVNDAEAMHKLKPDNEARIVWANDTTKQKTDYSIVYLHGFSASQKEGDPVHRNIAKKFGYNLFLSRLAEHGIDTVDQLVNLTADKYWESAKQALAIGNQLGKETILMSTSTGGTLALQLAAAYPDKVAALILLSPNIAINDPFAWVLNDHWGLQIARMVKKSDYVVSSDDRPLYKQYWNKPYRLEGAVALEELLETTMNKETFEKIHQPVLLLYYYQDDHHQDEVVKVSSMLTMFDELGTPAGLKRKMAMPLTGNHVLASPIKSGDVPGVENQVQLFMEQVLGMKLQRN
ncbi:MAG: alpha/beta hydrolase [Bacteroidetes bacterium]|nr:MAG: alpha/beta hydrolase [Bacteroidota bacterium]